MTHRDALVGIEVDAVVLDEDVLGRLANVDAVAIGSLKPIDAAVPHNASHDAVVVDRIGIRGVVADEVAVLDERGSPFHVDAVARVGGVKPAMTQDDGSTAAKDWALTVLDIEVFDQEVRIQSGECGGKCQWVRASRRLADHEVAQHAGPVGIFKTKAAPARPVAAEETHRGLRSAIHVQGALDPKVPPGGHVERDSCRHVEGDAGRDDEV